MVTIRESYGQLKIVHLRFCNDVMLLPNIDISNYEYLKKRISLRIYYGIVVLTVRFNIHLQFIIWTPYKEVMTV